MARKRGKMALYEVASKIRLNSDSKSVVDSPAKADPVLAEHGEKKEYGDSVWPKKPRVLQFNNGRVEFSLPFQVVTAIILGVFLVCLVMFRFGQIFERKAGVSEQVSSEAAVDKVRRAEPVAKVARAAEPVFRASKPVASPEVPAILESQGSNNIVITQYGRRSDLEPVKAYFDSCGIATEIVRIGNDYYLRTQKKYDNPSKVGTDGYYALKKVKETGAGYKSPAGFESFGSRPFQDAYGKKFKD